MNDELYTLRLEAQLLHTCKSMRIMQDHLREIGCETTANAINPIIDRSLALLREKNQEVAA